MRNFEFRIPRDPKARARLFKFAGLTDEERHALDVWRFTEEQKRQRGVLLYDAEPRPVGVLPPDAKETGEPK